MKYPFNIRQLKNEERKLEEHKRLMDAAAAQAINILREPFADTFLGRKHYDLIPLPYEIE